MLNSETPSDKVDGRTGPSLQVRLAATLACLLLASAALAVWLWPKPAPPAPAPNDEESDQELTAVNPGYAGIDSCAECHAKRAAVFKTSRHYLACRTAAGVSAPGFAPGRGRYDTRIPGLRFEMTRSGEDFFAVAVQATPQGERRIPHRIGLVYGSGNTRDEMYFAWQDGRLLHLPVAWLYPLDRWGDASDTLRALDTPPSCLECHNTWISHTPGIPLRYRSDDMLLGVTCERCHGPGREHSEYHRQHPKDDAHAILHPGTLSRERLMDLCAQCHGNTRMLKGPFSYRPGQPLEDFYRTVKARYREDDTTTNQVQFLGESRCFQKSKMTCITCHDPHSPKSPRASCLKCHKPASCTDQPSQPAAVRGDCVGCHMPQRIWMNSHFYTTTDDRYVPVAPRSEHRIAVYPEAKQAIELAWLRKQPDESSRAQALRLAGRLKKHWLDESERLRAAGRFKAAIGAFREALRVVPDPKTSQRMQEVIARQVELDDLTAKASTAARRDPGEAIRLLTKILEIRPDDAHAHGELGTIQATTGRRDESIPHLQSVVRCDPNDSSGVTRLAWLADVEGRPEEALALCARADKIERGHPTNHYVWGMALSRQKRWADAEKHFRKTLEINPTHGKANQGLSESLLQQGQVKESIRFARRSVRWGGANDPEALLTLAEAYAADRRLTEARDTLERALAIAERNNPSLAATIVNRLRQLQ